MNFGSAVKAEAIDLVKTFLTWGMPKAFFNLQMRFKRRESEVFLIPQLMPAGGVAVDVGANEGLWVYHLQKVAARVIAFEPIPVLARNVARKSSRNVEVMSVALSAAPGLATLRVPRRSRSLATMELANKMERRAGQDVDEIKVEVRTLDSYRLPVVDLIKIDVEGHELSVLKGAEETLYRCTPILVIEIEDVHNPGAIGEVTRLLERNGYRGAFYDGGTVRPIEEFDKERDQRSSSIGTRGKAGRYINNFIFSHARRPLSLR